jgi:hypothetical protein
MYSVINRIGLLHTKCICTKAAQYSNTLKAGRQPYNLQHQQGISSLLCPDRLSGPVCLLPTDTTNLSPGLKHPIPHVMYEAYNAIRRMYVNYDTILISSTILLYQKWGTTRALPV